MKYRIVIEFSSDQPVPADLLDHVSGNASAQLESLSDGDVSEDFPVQVSKVFVEQEVMDIETDEEGEEWWEPVQ